MRKATRADWLNPYAHRSPLAATDRRAIFVDTDVCTEANAIRRAPFTEDRGGYSHPDRRGFRFSL